MLRALQRDRLVRRAGESVESRLGKWPGPRAAVATLWELFLRYGPPLALKVDNASGFIAQVFLDLLVQYTVAPLFSPPLTPQYNGAVEAGNGSLKTHTRLEALRYGRMIWTCDDLEVACSNSNTFARPWGLAGPSPDQQWAARPPITPAERGRFLNTLASLRTRVLNEQHLHTADLTRRAVRAAVDRAQARRALEQLGYLFVARGTIRPLLKSNMGTFIT
jgi:hypothetical protein